MRLSNRTEAYQPGVPHLSLGCESAELSQGPTLPGYAILAERQRLEAEVAQLRAALARKDAARTPRIVPFNSGRKSS